MYSFFTRFIHIFRKIQISLGQEQISISPFKQNPWCFGSHVTCTIDAAFRYLATPGREALSAGLCIHCIWPRAQKMHKMRIKCAANAHECDKDAQKMASQKRYQFVAKLVPLLSSGPVCGTTGRGSKAWACSSSAQCSGIPSSEGGTVYGFMLFMLFMQ